MDRLYQYQRRPPGAWRRVSTDARSWCRQQDESHCRQRAPTPVRYICLCARAAGATCRCCFCSAEAACTAQRCLSQGNPAQQDCPRALLASSSMDIVSQCSHPVSGCACMLHCPLVSKAHAGALQAWADWSLFRSTSDGCWK